MVFTDVTDVLLGVTFRQCPTAAIFIFYRPTVKNSGLLYR